MGLTPQELVSRRAFDDEVIRSMLPSTILEIVGFSSVDALQREREATLAEGAAGQILVYAVRYRFPMLVGRGKTVDGATVTFNAGVHDYPFTTPIAQVTSRPQPWSPHVQPERGFVCQGFAWQRAKGRMLLAHAIVHVARLLNCDEEDREASYVGYNADAIHYWRAHMQRQPVTPGLKYPAPRVEVTHGVAANEAEPVFRMLDAAGTREAGGQFRLMDPDESSGIRLIGGV